MKKILLVLIIAGSTIANGFAQLCSPDLAFTLPGIYPDSATGLADAYTGSPYYETITVIVPTDTIVPSPFGPGNITVDITEIILDSVNGLPNNFVYNCNPSNCEYPGGSTGCVGLYSTSDPTASDIGVYPLKIYTTTNATVPSLFGITTSQVDTITSYFIEILDGSSVGIKEFDNSALMVSEVAPNPVTGLSKIEVISGVAGTGKLLISNLLGGIVSSQQINLNNGVSTFTINGGEFESGIYLVTISNEYRTVTKRIAIKN